MTQVAGDRGSTVIFPLPMDLIGPLIGRMQPARSSDASGEAPR
jgi:hypothetical protein